MTRITCSECGSIYRLLPNGQAVTELSRGSLPLAQYPNGDYECIACGAPVSRLSKPKVNLVAGAMGDPPRIDCLNQRYTRQIRASCPTCSELMVVAEVRIVEGGGGFWVLYRCSNMHWFKVGYNLMKGDLDE